jgi:hypothetical protein
MDRFVFGGNINYGQIAGILMLDSTIPLLSGDPGHAETFSFIYEAKEKGKNLWWRWFDRLADYCERKFGPDWQKDHGFKVR